MSWSCGIVGLPNAGKSTLFKALTAQDVTIENYPFSTVDPNKAIVPIPDPRLRELAAVCSSEKITPATLEVIDVAGLVKGASKGEGMGNQFLGHLRNVDLLMHVLGGFSGGPLATEDPRQALEIISLELALADLEVVVRRREKLLPKLKSGDSAVKSELELLNRVEHHLDQGLPLRTLNFQKGDYPALESLSLLTLKDIIYIYNVSEEELFSADTTFFPSGSSVVTICARLEADLVDLPPQEREPFLQVYGLEESQTERLLKEAFAYLRLITFFTVKGTEARSWLIPDGSTALQAAGNVHTDMAKGFINAEVLNYQHLVKAGSLAAARDKGLARVEGKGYTVNDGDVLYFRFRS